MSPKLTMIYMDFLYWLALFNFRVDQKADRYMIDQAESRVYHLKNDFEKQLNLELNSKG